MPESGRGESAAWHIAGWSLRTKVAVVLVVPTVVALLLGGIRVYDQLDTANRLSTVRDQLRVLAESVTLIDLVAEEQLAAVTRGSGDLDDRIAAVDAQVLTVRDAADFASLPATVDRRHDDALAALAATRQQAIADTSPLTLVSGYRQVLVALADLVPDVVSSAHDEDLDDRATSVRALLVLRATLATEEALIRSDVDGSAGAAQDAAAEEAVLGRQVIAGLPADQRTELATATGSAQARRDALREAVANRDRAALPGLLPDLRTAAADLADLERTVFADLVDTVTARTNEARSDALRDSAIVLGALLAALAIALTVARSLLAPLHRLRSAALTAAHDQLPRTVDRVRAGERVDWRAIEPVPVHTGEEVGQLARAFDDMHQQAVRLAGEQAELRRQVSEMFMTLSRRSQSLVELQLNVIEELESDEQDPRRLAGLFRLDHLATRLRRNGENLQVLAGGTPPRRGSRPVSVVELLRAATSEIADYRRVTLGHAPGGSVRASAATDLVHILAELLENATRFSPPDRKVVLTADRDARGGLLFEVIDGGLGMAEDDLAAANARLAATDVVDPETTRRMGLYVVSQLAARHEVTVRLRPTYDSSSQAGVTASIHVPNTLVIPDSTPPAPAIPAAPAGTAPAGTAPAGTAPAGTVAAPAETAAAPAMATLGAPVAPPPEPPVPADAAPVGWFTPTVDPDAPASTPQPAPPPLPETTQEPPEPPEPAVFGGPPPTAPPVGTTAAGLPMRKPGGRVPEAPVRRPEPGRADFRDPDRVRGNLSRHYDGMRAARRARDEGQPRPETDRSPTTTPER